MNEHPILFNGEMVLAILAGKKTQTRRAVKEMNGFHRHDYYESAYLDGEIWTAINDSGGREIKCPYGTPGDRLWVREGFARGCCGPIYRADCGRRVGDECWEHLRKPGQFIDVHRGGWKPSIHMPRWASRITLEVVAVRVERVQEISEGDALTEGVEAWGKSANQQDDVFRVYLANTQHLDKPCDGPGYYYRTGGPIVCFQMLWTSINAKRGLGWSENPYVWVVEFKVKELTNEQ